MKINPCVLFPVLAVLTGCAAVPYTFSTGDISANTAKFEPAEPQIERGEPYAVIDGLGHYLFSLPTKLVLFNWDIENHDISPGTEAALSAYIEKNNLKDVKIRLNQYSPGGEWVRLVDNEAVGWGWRYTVGLLSWLSYTIFPGRVFGGDNFNPFTNTISLYSDHPAVALHEAGHAKDFALTESKGSYAVLGLIPFASLWFEAEATGDAVGYMKEERLSCKERDGYKVLYPAYATYIGGELTHFVSIFTPINSLAALAAVIPAHIAGRIKADQVEVDAGCDEPCNPAPQAE